MSESTNFKDVEVFKGKSLSDVFKDIYKNTKDKDEQINTLIQQLSPLVQSVADAVQLIPLIRDYLDTGVKNNEHLVKMAAIAQRAMSTKTSQNNDNDEFVIPQHELDELRKNVVDLKNSSDEIISIDLTSPMPTGSNVQ